jgi:hypothetical protein
MDAYLTRGAMQTLRSLALVSGAGAEGFLLGHRCGPRRLVEDVLPTRPGFFPSLESFIESDRLLGGRVVGFFSFKPAPARLKKILAPFAVGKIFLDASSLASKRGAPRAFLVDFDRAFRLRPLPCVREKEIRHAR